MTIEEEKIYDKISGEYLVLFDKTNKAFKKGNLKEYLEVLNKYIAENKIITYNTIHNLVELYILNRDFDQAYKIIQTLEEQLNNYNIADRLAHLYFYCFKPKDAERVYFAKNDVNNKKLLIEIYLRQGRIIDAKKIIDEELSKGNQYSSIQKYKKMIDNYIKYGSFIETEYNCFIENGNRLEPGHIVFLKHKPLTTVTDFDDLKVTERPYMVWKIENDQVELFPVEYRCSDRDYKLFCQNYRNTDLDRKISNRLCKTTVDNILSVKDKLNEHDFKMVMMVIFNSIYFSKQLDSEENRKFLNDYVGEAQENDIIVYRDIDTKELFYYFVLGKENNDFNVVEIDINNNQVIDNNVKIYTNDLIYEIIKLNHDQIKNVLLQLGVVKSLTDLTWRRIVTHDGRELIVLNVCDNIFRCISSIYSSSYLDYQEIEKEDILFKGEIISEEQQEEIKIILKERSEQMGFKYKIKSLFN